MQVAIKKVSIKKVHEFNLGSHIYREKEILIALKDHPHVIELLATGKGEDHLIFVFEVSPNGTIHELC